MNDEESFLRPILATPEDAAVRLVYADWLEERGDARADFLRLDAELQRSLGAGQSDPALEQQVDEARQGLDRAWSTFVTTLGRPFRLGPESREFFDCERARLPFNEPIGLRGRVVTFESQFRSEESWQPTLANDLQLLCGLELRDCSYGAASIQVHPFICELEPTHRPLTGADILKALKARDFKSRYIQTLDATHIPFPGYHPGNGRGVENDEIHNDFFSQKIFQRADDDGEGLEINEFTGTHGVLKQAVVDGQLWYVLLHITPEQHDEYLFSRYVVLFAVGRSLTGDRLIGVVTHQVCHNLCD